MQIRSRSVLPATNPNHTNLGLCVFGIILRLEQEYGKKKKSEGNLWLGILGLGLLVLVSSPATLTLSSFFPPLFL